MIKIKDLEKTTSTDWKIVTDKEVLLYHDCDRLLYGKNNNGNIVIHFLITEQLCGKRYVNQILSIIVSEQVFKDWVDGKDDVYATVKNANKWFIIHNPYCIDESVYEIKYSRIAKVFKPKQAWYNVFIGDSRKYYENIRTI